MIININEEQIKAALVTGTDNQTYLLDQDTVISAPDSSKIGQKFTRVQDQERNKYTKAVNKKSGFTICNEQPLDAYNRAIREQVIFLLVIAAGSVVTMLLLIYSFTKPYLCLLYTSGSGPVDPKGQQVCSAYDGLAACDFCIQWYGAQCVLCTDRRDGCPCRNQCRSYGGSCVHRLFTVLLGISAIWTYD